MFIFSYLTLKARPDGFRQIIALYAFNTAATEVLALLPGWWFKVLQGITVSCMSEPFCIQRLSLQSALYAFKGSAPKYMSGGGVVTSHSQANCVGAAQTLSVPSL